MVGEQGTTAIYRRGLHLASTRHPFLVDAIEPAGDLPVRHQTLLASLIGPSLAARLLQPAWQGLLAELRS